ncbi:MAG: type 4a pilus biogenesis protein PilO [Pyrinomonadaceae bacterium]
MEKLKTLAWYWQLLVLIGVGSVFYALIWYFVTSGMKAEVQDLNDQVAQMQSKNQAAKIATQRINEFRTLFATKEQEYDELKVLLPEEREITNVLQGLQETASESRLIVSRFSPRDDSQEDFIMAKPVEVEVDSNFGNLREFFDRMAKLQRIVSISDFSLKQLDKQTDSRTLHAQFLLTAYYASPDDLNTLSSPAPQVGPDGKPLPPGAPAPAGAPPAPGAAPAPPAAQPPAPAAK